MACNLEFDVLHTLVSKFGELEMGVADLVTGRAYKITSDGYKIVPSLRVTQDNISQEDGSVLHPRWTSGQVAIMKVEYWVMDVLDDGTCPDGAPACGQDLHEMDELLTLHLNAIRKQSTDPAVNQRLRWQPTGYGDERMLDNIQLLQIWDPSYDLGGAQAAVTFAVESPFPYAIDATEIDTSLDDGIPTGIGNAGNADQSPVVRVAGPTAGFNLENLTTGEKFVYDSGRPGAAAIAAGHFAEIDFFRGTVFLDGDADDLVAGVDPIQTDYWKLGANTTSSIWVVGASATVLSNNAWV